MNTEIHWVIRLLCLNYSYDQIEMHVFLFLMQINEKVVWSAWIIAFSSRQTVVSILLQRIFKFYLCTILILKKQNTLSFICLRNFCMISFSWDFPLTCPWRTIYKQHRVWVSLQKNSNCIVFCSRESNECPFFLFSFNFLIFLCNTPHCFPKSSVTRRIFFPQRDTQKWQDFFTISNINDHLL